MAEESYIAAAQYSIKNIELKTGRPIKTISEFEQVTKEFSKSPMSEIEKLIKEIKKKIKNDMRS